MREEIKELTGLRFVAAFYVFVFHIQLRGVLPSYDWRLDNLISQGALGVAVFFVLSGFLMFYAHYHQTHIPWWPFMQKRFIRIVPAFWAGCAALLICGAVLMALPSAPVAALDVLLLNAWLPSLSMEWIGAGSWSIVCEVFFYALTPFLVMRLRHQSPALLLALLVGCFVLAPLPGLYHAFHPEAELFHWVYSFPPARLAEFVAGMLAAILVVRQGWRVPAWVALGAAGATALYLSYMANLLPGWVAHNWLVLPSLVLLISSLRTPSLLWSWLGSRPMLYLGKISYGFYIWQIVLLQFIDVLQEQDKWPKQLHSSPASAGLLAVNLLVAALSYHLLEYPAHKWLSSKIRKSHIDPPVKERTPVY